MTQTELLAQIEALKAQNAALVAANTPKPKGLSLKVSAKGAISIYGMGRFPVTLYASQWEQILTKQEDLKAFILANTATLAVKGAV